MDTADATIADFVQHGKDEEKKKEEERKNKADKEKKKRKKEFEEKKPERCRKFLSLLRQGCRFIRHCVDSPAVECFVWMDSDETDVWLRLKPCRIERKVTIFQNFADFECIIFRHSQDPIEVSREGDVRIDVGFEAKYVESMPWKSISHLLRGKMTKSFIEAKSATDVVRVFLWCVCFCF